MVIKTRREMRMEVENYKNLVHDRLQGRDVEKAVEIMTMAAEDVIIDEIGMPEGWDTENEDHQAMLLDIVAEQMIKIYFTPGPPPATIDEI